MVSIHAWDATRTISPWAGYLDRCRPLERRPAIDAGRVPFRSELKTRSQSDGLHLSQTAVRHGRELHPGEPVRLVCLSVHHKNIGMFMTHDFKAHVPPPPAQRKFAPEAWPPVWK